MDADQTSDAIEAERLGDLLRHPDAIRVRKRPVATPVVFANVDGTCETREGPVRYRTGDAILTGGKGERWPMRRADFDGLYKPSEGTRAGHDGTYFKQVSAAVARRLDHAVKVPVGWLADPLKGQVGDWLLRYADGAFGVVADDIFRATYEADAGETRWPP